MRQCGEVSIAAYHVEHPHLLIRYMVSTCYLSILPCYAILGFLLPGPPEQGERGDSDRAVACQLAQLGSAVPLLRVPCFYLTPVNRPKFLLRI